MTSDSESSSSSRPKPSSITPPPEVATDGARQHQRRYPNAPETVNPNAETLRDQWRFAVKQYSRWYSHAWGTAILAGASFFALGWIIKGSNPLPSFKSDGRLNSSAPDDKPPSPDHHHHHRAP
ncbi:hypothetical protein M569_16357 [Genlisea aurea]|uniref:Uncharacterized protein n=1 Tax=Genlisea aurea TaxID=192259 RepID=S8DGH4_9LAMI|nr:hypothetical protein M569_16357 [Genlisea aurea]